MANKFLKKNAYNFAGRFIRRFGDWSFTKKEAIQAGYRAGYNACLSDYSITTKSGKNKKETK